MMKRFNIVTLCGSTRFKDDFIRIQKELSLAGNIVISVGLFGHQGDDEVWLEGVKEMLDEMHLAKIDMADEIFVINPDGYIGESTKREISYAKAHGKTINSIVPLNLDAFPEKAAFDVTIDRKWVDYIKEIAKDSGTNTDFVVETIIQEYDRLAKNE